MFLDKLKEAINCSMSISFVTHRAQQPRTLGQLSSSDLKSLDKLLSGPVSTISNSDVKIVKDDKEPIPLRRLSPNSLFVLQSTVNSYCHGVSETVDFEFTKDEIELVIAMANNLGKEVPAARTLGTTRSKVRTQVENFNKKYGKLFNLNTFNGLKAAHTAVLAQKYVS